MTKKFDEKKMGEYIASILLLSRLLNEYAMNTDFSSNAPFSMNLVGDDVKVLKYRLSYLLESKYIHRTNPILLSILVLLPILSNIVVLEPNYNYKAHEEGAYSISDLKEKGVYIIHHKDGGYGIVIDEVEGVIENPFVEPYNQLPIIEEE